MTADEADIQVNGTQAVQIVKQNGGAPTTDAEVDKDESTMTTKNEEEKPSMIMSAGSDTHETKLRHSNDLKARSLRSTADSIPRMPLSQCLEILQLQSERPTFGNTI